MDKKWYESATIIGTGGALLTSTLINFDLMPADANEPMNEVFTNLMELVRALFAVYGVYGARKVVGKIASK
jgi:hypothetical protein